MSTWIQEEWVNIMHLILLEVMITILPMELEVDLLVLLGDIMETITREEVTSPT